MPRRSKLTDEERIAAVQEYLEGKGSYATIAKRYGIDHERFRQMVIRAKVDGIESVKIRRRNKKYSAEIKLKAVTEYLEGKCSQMEIWQNIILHKMQFSGNGSHAIIVVKTSKSERVRKEELP